MRICMDCSEKMPDVAMVCTSCGSKNLSVIMDDEQKPARKKLSIKQCVSIIVSLAVIIGAICGYLYFTKTLPAKPVKEGIQAVMTGDVDTYLSKMNEAFRSSFSDSFIKSYGSLAKYNENQKAMLTENYGDNSQVKVTVLNVQEVSKQMLAAMNINYKDYSVEITKAYYITLKIHIYNESGAESVSSETLRSVKIGNSWYLFEDIS